MPQVNPQALIDYIQGGAKGVNKSILGLADTLVGNPVSGAANFFGADIARNPITRAGQEYGIGGAPANDNEALAHAITGTGAQMALESIPIAGDVAGLKNDIDAWRADQLPTWALPAAGLGLLPGVPAASRYLMDKLPGGHAERVGDRFGANERGMLMQHASPHMWAPEPGSPDGIPRYDASTSRTGEGAAMYGEGLYASDPGGAAQNSYLPAFSKPGEIKIDGRLVNHGGMTNKDLFQIAEELDTRAPRIRDGIDRVGRAGSVDGAIGQIDDLLPDLEKMWPGVHRDLLDERAALEALQSRLTIGEGVPANLYEFDFPDELVPELMNLDAGIAEQSEKVRKAFAPWMRGQERQAAQLDAQISEIIGDVKAQGRKPTPIEVESVKEMRNKTVDLRSVGRGRVDNMRIDYVNDLVSRGYSRQQAGAQFNEMMENAGVPGSRYLDGASRADGTGTSNYVLFRPQDSVADVRRIK